MYFIFHPISFLNHLIARLFTDQITFFISIILFFVIAFSYKNSFWQRLDKRVFDWVLNSKDGFLRHRANDFAIFGNAVFHILFSIVLSLIFLVAKHKFSIVFSILFVLIFSWGLNRLLKLIFRRTRPEQLSSDVKKRLSYCFPSGHVMASIPIYFFCAIILQGLISFLPWYLIALIISFFVIMSRIYLNHHYFTDVLAGIACGIFCLNISIWVYFFIGLV